MHTQSKKDLDSVELDTVRVSGRAATSHCSEWVRDTSEEATVNVKDLHLFVTAQLLEDAPPVLPRVNPAKIMGIPTSGLKATDQIFKLMAVKS